MPYFVFNISAEHIYLIIDIDGCNCRVGPHTCPVGGKCLTHCVVYEETSIKTQSGKKETYTGVTSRPFKSRLYEHNAEFER